MAVAVLGALVGLAGVEHGVGEILQGAARPAALIIESWPDARSLEILSGEPAMTVVPNLFATGVLAVTVGLAIAAWSVWFAARPRGGLVLVGLSVLLLLVGGGLLPPLMGIVVGAVAARIGVIVFRPLGAFGRAIAPAWRWFLVMALAGYLGLMPGMVFASTWGLASGALVIGLAAVAFSGFGLALAAARAHDRMNIAVTPKVSRAARTRQVSSMASQTVPHTESTVAADAASWLSALVAALVAGASAAGLWFSDLYTDGDAVAAMFRGYDVVTLVVVAPLLALTLLPNWRDRASAQLVRISMLTYCVYNYAYYLFGAQLNGAVLAHIGIVTASLYALVSALVSLDVKELAAQFRPSTHVRPVAVIIGLLALSLATIQISGLAVFALTGATPEEPSQLVVPLVFTRLGAVLDLLLLVPAYVLAAVWLWRRRPWGYVLATAILLAGALHQVSYITGMLFQLVADIPGAAFDLFEPVIISLYAIASILLLGGLRKPAHQRHTAPAASAPRRISGAELTVPRAERSSNHRRR